MSTQPVLWRRRTLALLPPLVLGIAVAATWFLVSFVEAVPAYMLPGPGAVVRQMVLRFDRWAPDIAATFLTSLFGFVIAAVIGFSAGSLSVAFPRFGRALNPFWWVLQAIPVLVLTPFLVLWLGPDSSAKTAAAAIVSLFPIVTAFVHGLQDVAPEYLSLFRLYRASFTATMTRLRLPAASGVIFAGLRTGAALALVGAVVSEFLIPGRGLGSRILTAAYRYDTTEMFAAAGFCCLLSLMLFVAIAVLEWILVFWHPRFRSP